jgi:hypothetical protein
LGLFRRWCTSRGIKEDQLKSIPTSWQSVMSFTRKAAEEAFPVIQESMKWPEHFYISEEFWTQTEALPSTTVNLRVRDPLFLLAETINNPARAFEYPDEFSWTYQPSLREVSNSENNNIIILYRFIAKMI